MKKEKLWTLPFVLILFINSLNGIATFMVNPIMPDYLVSKGMLFEYTGVISSLLSWVALCIRPFSGAMSDRLNKKKLMFFSYFMTVLCMGAYFIAKPLPVIIVIRILHGIAFAISGTVSMSFATDYVPKSRIAEGISFIGVASLIGTMIGPQVGSIISEAIGMSYIFAFSAALCAFCLLLILVIPYKMSVKNPINKKTHAFKFSDFFAKELLIYVLVIGLFSFGNGIISYYLVNFGSERHIDNIALFFTVYSISMLIMKPFVGRLQDSKGIKVILYPCFVFYACGMFLLSGAHTLLPVLVAAVFKAIGQGNGTPAIQAESVKRLGMGRNGVAISTCLIGQDLGNGMGPIFASIVVKNMGYSTMFTIFGCMLIVGLFVYYLYSRKNKNGEDIA